MCFGRPSESNRISGQTINSRPSLEKNFSLKLSTRPSSEFGEEGGLFEKTDTILDTWIISLESVKSSLGAMRLKMVCFCSSSSLFENPLLFSKQLLHVRNLPHKSATATANAACLKTTLKSIETIFFDLFPQSGAFNFSSSFPFPPQFPLTLSEPTTTVSSFVPLFVTFAMLFEESCESPPSTNRFSILNSKAWIFFCNARMFSRTWFSRAYRVEQVRTPPYSKVVFKTLICSVILALRHCSLLFRMILCLSPPIAPLL
mmetsp:Transcript_9129/g.13693  ORF Transcript_9129/g.13693 Transcript_9129/m.13693 type:complete len:259 (+) Transcript_9129:66-842(+)